MASNIPKFASFRPKSKETKETTQPEQKLHESRHREERERHRELERTSTKHAKERTSKHVPERPSRVSLKEQERLYYVDRKGDPDNVKYGSLNRYEIPLYRRHGFGNVLGLPTECKIDREQSSDKRIVLSGTSSRRHERPLISSQRNKDVERALRFVKPSRLSSKDDDADFIELSGGKKRKRDSDSVHHENDYRSLETKEAADRSDSDLESESEAVDDSSAEITQTNSSLIQRTRDGPDDLEAWLELVEHQEAMMRLGRMSSHLSSLDRRNLAEVRISTYEQAIKRIGNDPEKQVRLHIGMLSEALRAWDDEKLAKKWAEVLEQYPSSPQLWIGHLDFVQSRFTNFKHDSCRRTYHRCFKVLRNSSNILLPETYLHILIRLTCMIRDSGYQELASAVWQTVLEFNLMDPDSASPDDSGKSRDQLFEDFWESEQPRIGENGAKGWKKSSILETFQPPPAAQLVEALSASSALENFKLRELDHMKKLKYPGRTTDEVGGEDPFHLVLYSDLEEYLHILPPNTPAFLVVDAFLCYSGMPRLPAPGFISQPWWLDPFLQRHPIDDVALPGTTPSFSDTVRILTVSKDSSQVTIEALFDRSFPRATEQGGRESDLSIEDLQFIRRALRLLITESSNSESIGEYLLAFELNYFPDESFKTAKQLLKARPASLLLYNAYGLLESRRGNYDKADQVLCAAMSMHKDATPFTTPGTLQLYSNWVWEALRRDQKLEALWRLVFPPGIAAKKPVETSSRPDPSSLLRGRTVLGEAKERALLGRDLSSAVVCTSLIALLAYLSADQDPSAGLQEHTRLSDWFLTHGLSKDPAAQLHAQQIAHFLAYHATHSPIVKPALIRDNLDPLIGKFPNNTVLLSIFAANEARFPIDDRVRGIMRRLLADRKAPRNISAWLFAINYEMQRGEIAGSTSDSVRALFAQAEDEIGAHCPAIWKSHLLFELAQYNKELAKRPSKRPRRDGKKSKYETRVEQCHRRVKETFFKGLTHLPWSKDFMMLAFSHLWTEFLTEDELRRVYDVMIEKELRVYVDLDMA